MTDLDPKTTALVLIDLQNGVLGRKLEPLSAEELVERGKALAERFRAAGSLVVLVNVVPAPDDPPRRVDEPSPFHGTDLDLELRRRGVRTIALGGVATQFGVESTARQAWELGYKLVIVSDATTSTAIEPHENSIRRIFPRIAHVTNSDAVAFSG